MLIGLRFTGVFAASIDDCLFLSPKYHTLHLYVVYYTFISLPIMVYWLYEL
ncbi:MAG: hypothetical protein QW534_08645 [Candidatus Methanomethylicia archaeon]